MRREVAIEEISDGRLYELNDMVKADCHDCAGCCDCCKGMGNSVVLDPLDVHRLSAYLKKEPEKLLEREIALDVFDGNILPHLKMRFQPLKTLNQPFHQLNNQKRLRIANMSKLMTSTNK